MSKARDNYCGCARAHCFTSMDVGGDVIVEWSARAASAHVHTRTHTGALTNDLYCTHTLSARRIPRVRVGCNILIN